MVGCPPKIVPLESSRLIPDVQVEFLHPLMNSRKFRDPLQKSSYEFTGEQMP
jgi:hypothetical protein